MSTQERMERTLERQADLAVDRRNLLKMAGIGVAALGAMAVLDIDRKSVV